MKGTGSSVSFCTPSHLTCPFSWGCRVWGTGQMREKKEGQVRRWAYAVGSGNWEWKVGDRSNEGHTLLEWKERKGGKKRGRKKRGTCQMMGMRWLKGEVESG